MTPGRRLWAFGFDRMGRAAEVRAEVLKLGAQPCLGVLDTTVAVCYPDGIVTLDGERFIRNNQSRRHTLATFIAAIALGVPPLTEAGVGALVRNTGTWSEKLTIDVSFVDEVGRLLKPGSSALFVLDHEADTDALLHGISGIETTVLKTTVDLERAKLIQTTLAAESAAGH